MIQGSSERIGLSMIGEPAVWPDPRWSLVGPAYPKDKCIHQIFEEQVSKTPDAIAVVFEEHRLSYRELNRRANQLAHHLLELGAGPEVPVALFLDRSLELAVAVLAILKAGAVNVPLDPAFPRDRLAFMLEDTRAWFVLTESRYAHALPATEATVLCLDREVPALARQSGNNPNSGVIADNLCTYYYTSGSTGTPKAVMMTHRVGCRLQWSHLNAVKLDDSDKTLVATTVGYGFFLGEFASGLMRGATAVLTRPGGYQDIDYLVEIVEREQITVISFVPSVLKHYLTRLKELGFERGRSLRHIVSHGERLPAELEDQLRTSLGARLHKFFGLTEAPVAAYWDGLARDVAGRNTAGRPTDMRFYLLDPQMQPVPVGEVGEIYLDGPGLARGYLNRPGLTAERFLPNPFSHEPGARFFRTGDFARWLPEGVIELLGRHDGGIKLRGLRVELGEIEYALSRHPAVREAVAVLVEDRPGDNRIVAYIVSHDEQLPSTEELNIFLARTLPGHMLPSSIVRLDRLPVLSSGKVNRRALAVSRAVDHASDPCSAMPRDPTEKALTEIWQRVLERERVGIHDDFFSIGGHSLRVIRLVSLIREELGVALPLNVVFQAPTVAHMAATLRQAMALNDPRSHSSRDEVPDQPFFCLYWGPSLAQYLEGQPVHTLEIEGPDRPPIYRIESTSRLLVNNMRAIQPKGPYFLGGFCAAAIFVFEMAQQLIDAGEKVALLVFFDAMPVWPPQAHPLGNRRTTTVAHKAVDYLRRWAKRDPAVGTAHLFRKGQAIVSRRIDRLRSRAIRVLGGELPHSMQIMRAIEQYQPRVYPGPIKMIVPKNRSLDPDMDPYTGPWNIWAGGGLEICEVPGDHMSMFSEPNIQVLAANLLAYLEQAKELRPSEISTES
jgi:amino acid adenylation domain-containing protein